MKEKNFNFKNKSVCSYFSMMNTLKVKVWMFEE